MTRKQKKTLIRLCAAFVYFAAVFVVDVAVDLGGVIENERVAWILPAALYLVGFAAAGWDVAYKAARNACRGRLMDENFLMCVAAIGAFATGEYAEAVAVVLFYQIGEWCQGYAVGRSRKSISSLMELRPDTANLLLAGGETEVISPSELKPGDVVIVNPGERVPVDGTVIGGFSELDVKALTGESLPKSAAEGDAVTSGAVNLTRSLTVRVDKSLSESTVTKILELVENAASQKAKSESFITRFARWYTPVVVCGAAALAIIPSLITGNWLTWVMRALNFLVVSCPCALVISVPLGFFSGIGAASRRGILVKGSVYLEKMNEATVFAFDKTGTLTKGGFAVASVVPSENKEAILALAARAEQGSSHPIAESIVAAYDKPLEPNLSVENVAGKGVIATTNDGVILCGSYALMRENGVKCDETNGAGSVVYVAKNGEFVGKIEVADEVKPEAKEAIAELKRGGARTIMLTGDGERVAATVAEKLGVDEYRASLLPHEKAEAIAKIKEENPAAVVCFAGDGINDAPVLAQADVGVSMGGVGSDAAIEASDVVLMRDEVTAICKAKKIAKKTLRAVRQNVAFALAVKAAILALSAVGLASMWLAIFADVGVMLLCVLNATRVNSRAVE